MAHGEFVFRADNITWNVRSITWNVRSISIEKLISDDADQTDGSHQKMRLGASQQ